jgi:hypothetical protein
VVEGEFMSDFSEYLSVCLAKPFHRDSWLRLSQFAYDSRDYLTGYWAAQQALKITNRLKDDDVRFWGSYPFDLAGTCAYYLGMVERSLELGSMACAAAPQDVRLILNLKMIRRHLNDIRIIILWPTVRPGVFRERIREWMSRACNENNIRVKVAVNTRRQRDELSEFADVRVVGTDRPGVCWACWQLTRDLGGSPGDIVILASDDFYPPDEWDAWVYSQFEDFYGCLLVNDGTNRKGVITIPILDYACLKFTNHCIYHPSYVHLWSDNEFYDVLDEQNLIKDLQQPDKPVFIHKHWYHGRREKDSIDDFVHRNLERDREHYESRKGLSLAEKLFFQI